MPTVRRAASGAVTIREIPAGIVVAGGLAAGRPDSGRPGGRRGRRPAPPGPGSRAAAGGPAGTQSALAAARWWRGMWPGGCEHGRSAAGCRGPAGASAPPSLAVPARPFWRRFRRVDPGVAGGVVEGAGGQAQVGRTTAAGVINAQPDRAWQPLVRRAHRRHRDSRDSHRRRRPWRVRRPGCRGPRRRRGRHRRPEGTGVPDRAGAREERTGLAGAGVALGGCCSVSDSSVIC
jgi:hypothetical protein